MNKLIIIGNLTSDPELRSTPQGTSVANFTVAVNMRRGEQSEAMFFRVTAWNKLAENCKHYLKKGSKVFVSGAVGCDTYKTSDGTFRAALTVNANEVEFLSTRAETESKTEVSQKPEFTAVETPSDLPF